jgi:two-component system response regulator DesR
LRILLAEDVAMVRGALIALIELEPGLKVVAAVGRGDDIVSSALDHRPDVAVIDIHLPGLDGLTAAAMLHDVMPTCKTLILTSLGQGGNLRRALDAHVSGYLLKDAPPDQLAIAIRNVAAGQRVIDPQLAVAAWESESSPLSAREHEILRMTAAGMQPAVIAGTLLLNIGTVRNHLTSIVAKLDAKNRVDAVRKASEAGWLP